MYVDVILPLFLDKKLTYFVPQELRSGIGVGSMVAVGVGKSKVYSAVVWALHETKPCESVNYKPVLRLLGTTPEITAQQLRLWDWIAEYYLCPTGEVMRNFLPGRLKIEGHVAEDDSVAYDTSPRVKTIRKAAAVAGKEALLKGCPAQLALFHKIEAQTPIDQLSAKERTALKELIKKTAAEVTTEQIVLTDRRRDIGSAPSSPEFPPLNTLQQQVLEQLQQAAAQKRTILLTGAAGSGKTELALRMIDTARSQGKEVLVLVPELGLNTLLWERISRYFGTAAVYDSAQSEKKRSETYTGLLEGSIGIIAGTRSAVGLPFRNLGLIIVEEEHDPSYKQSDSAPRYHARDCAVMLAKIHHAPALLISTTPSVESRYNAAIGKYDLFRIDTPFFPGKKQITVIGKRSIAKGEKEKRYFSKYLIEAIGKNIDTQRQTILFNTLRGFASWICCEECGFVPKCPRCDITLSYSKTGGGLRCRVCGTVLPVSKCPECGTDKWIPKGFGTEKMEQELKTYFPHARIVKPDAETLRHRGKTRQLFDTIACGGADIIIGTQSIAKGFDFPLVSTVGAVDADTLTNRYGFRTEEAAFQTLMQLWGRTSRSNKGRELILQVSNPDSELIRLIRDEDYEGLYRKEIASREAFDYPPFSRIILLTIRHRNPEIAAAAAEKLRNTLSSKVKECIVTVPPIERVKEMHRMQIVLKLAPDKTLRQQKAAIRTLLDHFASQQRGQKIPVTVDVDPLNI